MSSIGYQRCVAQILVESVRRFRLEIYSSRYDNDGVQGGELGQGDQGTDHGDRVTEVDLRG